MDLLSYVVLALALFLRHVYQDEPHTYARNMFALSLLIMYFRFLEAFLISRTIGPTLIMIKEMVLTLVNMNFKNNNVNNLDFFFNCSFLCLQLQDLKSFLLIASFVVLGVGIYYHANLWPDHQTVLNGNLEHWRIWTIISYPYWQLYGELNLDHLQGN